MKKLLKLSGSVLLILLLALALLLFRLAHRRAVPDNYTETVPSGGALEAIYLQSGSYAVSFREDTALQGFGKYLIYYPSVLPSDAARRPIVVFANGSGCKASSYPALFSHLASWGFAVIGTEEEFDWNGFSSEMCLRHLIRLNDEPIINDAENPFIAVSTLRALAFPATVRVPSVSSTPSPRRNTAPSSRPPYRFLRPTATLRSASNGTTIPRRSPRPSFSSLPPMVGMTGSLPATSSPIFTLTSPRPNVWLAEKTPITVRCSTLPTVM